MGYLCGFIIVGYLVLVLLSLKERLPTGCAKKGVAALFYKMGAYIFRRVHKRDRVKKKALRGRDIRERQLGKKMLLLNPAQKEEEQVSIFYIDRYATVMMIVLGGTLLCLLVWVTGQRAGKLQDGQMLLRNEYGEGDIPITLKAEVEGQDSVETISYVVEEREYTEEEALAFYEEAIERLPDEMLGENDSLEDVRFDLELPVRMEGNPFHIAWDSSSYHLVNTDGTVQNKELGEPEIVSLTAHFTYLDRKYDYVYYVQVNPPVYTQEEQLRKDLEEEMQRTSEQSKNGRELLLPGEVEERKVRWEEQKQDGSANLLILVAGAAVVVYLLKEREVDQKIEERKTKLLLDYPEIVNKLTLYMGAGMTVRNAFMKLGEDYRRQEGGEKRYVYEEILIACHELASGRSETEVYDHFGKRCQLQVYRKLCTLLSQNLRKGSNDLFAMLRAEVDEAFRERQKTARKLGEEAGTKLLLPMMLMLCVVMVIIMVPAYFSFGL